LWFPSTDDIIHIKTQKIITELKNQKENEAHSEKSLEIENSRPIQIIWPEMQFVIFIFDSCEK